MNNINNRNSPYYTMPSSESITCQCETIWCFSKMAGRLTPTHKNEMSQKILVQRNWAISIYIFQIIFAICKLCFGVLRKGKLPILFNVILIVSCLFGIGGCIYFSVVFMILYLIGATAVIIGVVVMAAVSISVKDDEGAFLWGLYAPFIIDFLILIWQIYFVFPTTKWYLRMEDKDEEEAKRLQQASNQVVVQQVQLGNQINVNQNQAVVQQGQHGGSNQINVNQVPSNPVRSYEQPQVVKKQSTKIDNYQVGELDLLQPEKNDRKASDHSELNQEDKSCIICSLNQKEGAFYPCGHVCCCVSCGNNFKNSFCPICRKLVVDFVKLYEA